MDMVSLQSPVAHLYKIFYNPYLGQNKNCLGFHFKNKQRIKSSESVLVLSSSEWFAKQNIGSPELPLFTSETKIRANYCIQREQWVQNRHSPHWSLPVVRANRLWSTFAHPLFLCGIEHSFLTHAVSCLQSAFSRVAAGLCSFSFFCWLLTRFDIACSIC